MVRQHYNLIVLLLCVLVVTPTQTAYANKKAKGKLVTQGQFFSTQISYKIGKKTKSQVIYCLGEKPGIVKQSAKGLLFTSYGKLKKVAKAAKKKAKFKALQKAGKNGCKQSNNNPANYQNLNQYTGTFGLNEAHILFDRFAFGATRAQLNQAVADGLNNTVDRLTTLVSQPNLDSIEKQLRCDGKLPSDPTKKICDPTDPNDLSTSGARYGLIYRMLHSINPFYEKLFMFAHDERLSASSSALSSCERHALIKYINSVRKFAHTGSYRDYMKDMNSDLLMHLKYLDGASNSGYSPNENYAREFWELGTVGPTNLSGLPVYNNLDISYSALAFSGWKIYGSTINGEYVCYGAFAPYLHAPGPKKIFNGTPYETVVYDMDDVLTATFNHPRTAEHLAEDIWKEFISPYATPTDIRELAKEIRDNNYNLLPVFRKIMRSKVLYSNQSRKSLIKHPLDLIIGFLRATEIPYSISSIDSELSKNGQRPLQPVTVFGWDEDKLTGEAYVVETRNTLIKLTTISNSTLTENGYNLHSKFLYGSPTADQTITRVAELLGVTLNSSQRAELIKFLDYELVPCSWGFQSQCNAGQSYNGQGQLYLNRKVFDSHPDSDTWWKVRGVLAIISMMPEYRMK